MTTVYTTRDHDTTLCHSPTEMIEETRFNGWKNYETWNISLWLQNDENLYSLCKEWVEHQVDFCYPVNYDIFRHTLNELCGETTPDGVRWDDESIDSLEVSEMMMDL